MNKDDKALLNDLGINPGTFESDFGRKTVNRGKDYFVRDKVLPNIKLEDLKDDGLEITGKVSGSGGAVYNCEVQIIPDLFSTDVMSRCDCPVYADCKHGVALLFTFLYSRDNLQHANNKVSLSDEQKIDHWLSFIEEFEEDIQREEMGLTADSFENESNKAEVIYILDFKEATAPNDSGGLAVKVHKAKKLKKGGYGKLYKLRSFYEVEVSSYSNVFCTYLDEEIVNALKGIESNSIGYYELENAFYLEGDYGELLLKQLFKTNRCFWQDQKTPPLKEGLPREISVFWQEDEKYLKSRFKTEPHSDGIYRIKDFHYLDLGKYELGLITHDVLTADQIIYLLDAPPIPKKMANKVSEQLFSLLPDADIPLPGKTSFKRVEVKTKPVNCLLLHAVPVPVDSGKSRLLHLASLSFEYDGLSYQPERLHELQHKISTQITDNICYRIFHDNERQSEALARLEHFGLQSLDPDQSPYGVLDMAMFGEYDLSQSVQLWDDFKQIHLPELESNGWKVHIDDSFSLEVEIIDEWHAELEESEQGDWFEMTLGFELDGKRVNILPLVVDLIGRAKNPQELQQSLKEKEYELLQLDDYQWVKIPTERLRLVTDTVIELYDSSSLNKEGNLEFSKHAGLHYGALLNDPKLTWKGADELKALNEKITNFSGIEKSTLPKGVKATLRDYQKTGYDWLQFLREYQLNGILADDMGLGKTLQALSNLLQEKQAGRATLPSLVIAPTSLMINWKNEAKKFTPDLNILVLQGQDRKEKFSQIANHDVILTTYPLMVRDTELYTQREFHYLILDEAQAIKNAKAKTTQIIFKIKANHRLCITGTPIENHLGELWSMFHFIMPGYLGTHEKFTKLFRTPIEKNGDVGRSDQLRKRVKPFMIRRTKELVAKELPEKTEIIRSVALSGAQRDLYETVRLAMDKKVRDEINKKGLARSHIMILDALLKLRQVCCDPQLVKLAKAKKVKESAKLNMLMEMVPEMVDEGRKILIFSQFTTMLDIIGKSLEQENIRFTKLTGQTRKREEVINEFQNGDAKVFLISLKAGGVGLNLTAADVVIHYDPWWNPAVENQATDRAYRIGQDKPVFVYKLLIEDSVEEKILQLQEKKKDIAESMYEGTGGKKLSFGQEELMDLLKPLE